MTRIADILLLGFYFLLSPGEYSAMDNEDASSFCYCYVHLLIHNRRSQHYTCPNDDFQQVTYIPLEFTNQKNGVHGELIELGRSGRPIWCPVAAILKCIRHFHQHNGPPHTPLYQYYSNNNWFKLTPRH